GIVELLHQEASGRHQVDDGRHAAADPVPVVEVDRHADAAGERQQVDDGVGRAADGGIDPDRVLEVLPGQDLRHDEVLMDHVDDPPAGKLGEHHAAGIDRRDRGIAASESRKSDSDILPAFTSSLKRQMSVPEPISCPRNWPFSIGPPETAIAGISQLAAPISRAGVVLSQPTSRMTPSMGLPRIDSSTSMLTRLRKSMAVGRRLDSPSDITGNSSGKPPASSTPRFTRSAICRKWALQGVNSDQVLQMPMTGRPSKESAGIPSFFIQLRCIMESRSLPPNQACERSCLPFFAITPCPALPVFPSRPFLPEARNGRADAEASRECGAAPIARNNLNRMALTARFHPKDGRHSVAKTPKTLDELFHDTLKDIYFAEKKILATLPKMAKAAQNADLKAAFAEHREQTEGHVERLEKVFGMIDKKPQGKTCAAILGITDEGAEIMEEYEGSPALDAGLIAAAQAVEHYEISRYGTLRTWAEEMGLDDAAELLQETLDEEEATDEKLTEIAEDVVNQEAEAA